MSRTEERDADLGALMADTLAEGRPAPELLVRYADDPAQLSDAERTEVEWHLAHTAGYAAQLRVLRRTDFAALARSAPRAPTARRWRGYAAAAVGLAAAAVLFLAIPREDSGSPAALAPSGASGPPPTEHADAAPPQDTGPGAPQADPTAPAAPAMQTARVGPATGASPDRASGRPEPGPADPGASSTPAPAPVQLALAAPIYRVPLDASARPRSTGALRGRRDLPKLRALVPAHVARTARAAPVLIWQLDALPPAGSRLEFSVTAPEAADPLIREVLPPPSAPGLQSIQLESRAVTLPVGVECTWSVALRADPEDPDTEVFTQGWVQRVEPAAELEARLAGLDAGERPAALADASLWYDALAELLELEARVPDAGASAALRSLAEQVGLDAP